MTIEPMKEEIIEDFSAVDAAIAEGKERDRQQFNADLETQLAPIKSQETLDSAMAEATRAKAIGDRRLKTGGALLASGVGLAAIIAAASLFYKTEVVHDTKIVEQVKTIEVPRIIETVKTIEIPKIIEKEKVVYRDRPVEVPAKVETPRQEPPIDIAPKVEPLNNITPTPGMKLTRDQFQNTPMFRTANKCAGRLVSHVQGELTLEDGSKCWDANSDGSVDQSTTTNRHNGLLVVCNDTGRKYPTGKPEKECYARLANGRIENIRETTRASSDPFSELFN